MHPPIRKKTLFYSIKEIAKFATPIVLGQLSYMLIGAGDIFVAARHGTKTLAAIGIANSISSPIFLIGIGLMLGISPILSKKRSKTLSTQEYFHACIVYSFIISFIFMSIIILTIPIVSHLGFEKELVPLIKEYLFIVSFSYIGSYLFHSLKEYLQANEQVIFSNSVSAISIFLNIFLNYVLVFGLFGIPELGIKGLAVSTIIVRTLMGLSLYLYISKDKIVPAKKLIRNFAAHVFKFSLPISISIFLEVLAFSTIMILVGSMGAIKAGMHSIALTVTSITFMVPLAISSAVSVKLSYFSSRNNIEKSNQLIWGSLIISICFMGLMALLMFLLPSSIIRTFSDDSNLLLIGIPVIYICALSQVFDGAQITLSGILRGFGLTRPTLLVTLAGYWLVGIPFGFYLAYILNLELLGFWIGILISLSLIAITLFIYMTKVKKQKFSH